MRGGGAGITVVIPTLNEQTRIERALACTAVPGVERIVVDGGSSDGTADAARRLRAEKVIHALPGRAHQMDAGYREAQGEVVVFLHADTRLDPGWSEAVLRALADPATAGGAFRLRFEEAGALLRAVEFGARLRARLGGLPYGDQALFVRKRVLDLAGGIAPVPIFEDLDLVRLIQKSGRLALLPECAWTSARRYARNGALRQVLRNQAALASYFLRLPRARVAAWYRRRPAA
ncbi:MAG TPA: TIGR04283 family arsenosugar biosynthesis glycosyltransferase [Myxococcota bacterium]|nr:TIGR04283 family arsenosugar biosynthesis glycosyltransferase [Myxococcota bacterium]